MSKQFTAASVLALVQEGRIKLSDDIREYLPEMPDFGTPITIDQLLSHTNGLRDWGEVSHSGSTAGYRAWLGRFPDNGLSLALLCNGSDVSPSPYAIADLYLPKTVAEPLPAKVPVLAEWYADERDGSAWHMVRASDGSVSANGKPVQAVTGGIRINQTILKLLLDGRLQGSSEGDGYVLKKSEAWSPSASELAAIAGRYASVEAHAVLVVSMKGGALRVAPDNRPSFTRMLTPAYTDAFAADDLTARLKRDASGKVVGLILSDPRVWALSFERMSASP